MSAIDELVAELCPDGVEYRNLYDVAHFDRGQVITAKNTVDGGIPVVAGGQKPAYYHNVSNRPAGTITVAGSGAYAGYVSMWDTPIWLSDAFSVAPNDEHELSSAFLYQLLKLNQNWIYAKKKGSGVPHVHGADLSRLQIPVPPIEVQREIVCILDTFTALTDTLTEELNCRRQQYAYYRDRLLSLESLEALDGKPVEMKRLDEVFDLKNGYTPSKKKAEYWENGEVNWFRMEDIRANGNVLNDSIQKVSIDGIKGGKLFEANSLIVATSATIGEHALVTVPFMCNQRFTCLTRKPAYRNSLDMKFVSHYASKLDEYCLENTNQGGFASVSMPAFKSFPIPVPSLATQQKVVDILDRFDALTTSLTDGLPAEIEARKAQYAYYRDRLLDFPRKEVAAS